ncbi:triose-phosphate transporter family-domain-containing protein [Xylariales sp. PMI_506]|nr:triose-phosphate transporter family-domain-containing protein [Xylariales sp. PMI_506]
MGTSILPISSEPKKRVEGRAGLSLHPGFYVGSWIFFSNLTILFNKWLIDDGGFRYPVILTCWHMIFASLATQVLARSTSLLDGRHNVKMTSRFYTRAVVPIGLLYSGSMVCSNLVYLYLSVAFIQMLKAASPFSTLVIAWLWGQENPTGTVVFKILVIVLGVLLASAGEIQFSWIGFLYQLGGLGFESLRVVMIQALMSNAGMSMDPLVSLYYYAPVCAIANIFVAFAAEWDSFQWSDIRHTGLLILLLNATIAFLLNVSSVLLIGKTSGLILHLTGVFKNILLVILSVFVWGTIITPLQIFGYGVALIGFVFYRASWSELKAACVETFTSKSSRSERNRSGAIIKVTVITGILIIVVLICLSGLVHVKPAMPQTWSVAATADQLSRGWLLAFGDGK